MKKLTLLIAVLCGVSLQMRAAPGDVFYTFPYQQEELKKEGALVVYPTGAVEEAPRGVFSVSPADDSDCDYEDSAETVVDSSDDMSDDEGSPLAPVNWTEEMQRAALELSVESNNPAGLLALSLSIPSDLHVADCVNERGESQLIKAVRYYIASKTHAEVIDILRTYWGAWAADLSGNGHDSALHIAIASGDRDLVQALIFGTSLQYPRYNLLYEDGGRVLSAPCDLQGINGDTILHRAVKAKDEFTIRLILTCDATVINLQNNNGNTPLHIAAQTNNPNAITILLESGAKPKITNNAGLTAFQLATSLGLQDAARAIEEHGVVLTKEYCDSLAKRN